MHWKAGERIFGMFDPHKVQMRRLLNRNAEGKRERKQTEKENKGKKKARKTQVYFWKVFILRLGTHSQAAFSRASAHNVLTCRCPDTLPDPTQPQQLWIIPREVAGCFCTYAINN